MTEKSYPRLENGVILYGPPPAPAKPGKGETAEQPESGKKATKRTTAAKTKA